MNIQKKDYFSASIYMFLSVIFFTVMILSIRVASEEVHSSIVVFFRNFFGILIIGPIIFRSGIKMLKTSKLKLYFLRALFGLLAMFTWFHGITITPLAEAVALNFTMPLFVTLIATIFLNETVGWRRWAATIFGFIGAMIVLRPGYDSFSWGHLEILLASLFMALSVISIKKLATTEPPERVVAYMFIIFAPVSFIPALYVWEFPSINALFFLVLVGTSGTLAHLCFTRSVKDVDISSIMPLDFARLPLTALLAYIIFSEKPDIATWIGGAVIFASTIYIVHRESINSEIKQPKSISLEKL